MIIYYEDYYFGVIFSEIGYFVKYNSRLLDDIRIGIY